VFKRPDTKLLVCARYARISPTPESEVGANYSIKSQDYETLECAKKRGYYTDDSLMFIDDNFSGKDLNRPAVQRLIDIIRAELIDVLLVFSLDRLIRKLSLQLFLEDLCEQHNVRLEFVNEDYARSPEGNLMRHFKGAMNEYEKYKIIERTTRCRRQKAREGFVMTNSVPFGYKYVGKKQGSRGTMVVIDAQAEIIRMVFLWACDPHLGPTEIARKLNKLGIPSPRAGKKLSRKSRTRGDVNDGRWGRTTVYQMLTNTAYIGDFHESIDGEEKITKCPSIVTAAVFHKVQANLRNKALRVGRPSKQYELSKMAVCKRCGSRLSTSPGSGGPTYRCGNIDRKDYCVRLCPAGGVSSKLLDRSVFTVVWSEVTNKATLKGWVRAYYGCQGKPAAGPDLKAQLAALLKQEKRAVDVVYDQNSSVPYAEAQKRLAAVKAQIEVVKADIAAQANVVAMPEDAAIESFCDEIVEPGEPTEFADRVEILKRFCEKVIYDDRTREFEIIGRVVLPAGNCYCGVPGDNSSFVTIPFNLKGRVPGRYARKRAA